jgi:hypothetical protein
MARWAHFNVTCLFLTDIVYMSETALVSKLAKAKVLKCAPCLLNFLSFHGHHDLVQVVLLDLLYIAVIMSQ